MLVEKIFLYERIIFIIEKTTKVSTVEAQFIMSQREINALAPS